MEVRLQKELDRVTGLLTELSKYISIKNENNEYGINTILENILQGLFNIVFDCRLENLNHYQKNYPAVDLGDLNRGIAIQVTTEDISTKMKKMLDRIKENETYQQFNDIYIFFCTTKEKPSAKECVWLNQQKIDSATEPDFTFPKDHVLFIEDIYRILSQTKDLQQIIAARKYLEKHLPERKKRFVIAASGIACGIIAMAVAIAAMLLQRPLGTLANINMEMQSHLLLELENANHQYEEGLENWRRLDYNRADRDIRKASEEISEHLSQAEIEMAKINNSLGCLYLDMGKYEEAYDYLNSAYVTFKNTFGAESVEVRTLMFSIAQYDYYMGDLETSLRMTQEILDASDPEKDMVIVTTISHFRAMIFDSLGDYNSAISSYEKILSLYGEVSEDGELSKELSEYVHDPQLDQKEKDYFTNTLKQIILTYNNLGQVYIHLEKYDEAAEALHMGLDLSLNNIYIGEQNLTTSKLYCNLAIVDEKQGRKKEAVDNIDLAMRIQQKLFDYEAVYPGLVEVYNIYGTLLMEQEKNEESSEFFTRALKLAEESFGENHPQTAEAYNALGTYQYGSGKYTEAAEAFHKAIEIRKNILGKNHPDTVNYYINLAKSQIQLGENNEAALSLTAAQEICDEFNIMGTLPERIKECQKEVM